MANDRKCMVCVPYCLVSLLNRILIAEHNFALGGWQNNAGGGPPGGPGQYNRNQYPPQPTSAQQWNSGTRVPGPPQSNQIPPGGPAQWDPRYAAQSQQPPYPANQQVI